MIIVKTLLIALSLFRPKEETIQPYVTNYIDQYKYMAIDEMQRSGIPASITMAQAIIESNAGSSKLARASNNHFGIKCKDYWNGESYFFPDDERDAQGKLIPSCFRMYESVAASYADHSEFLMNTDHYRPLFGYDKTDYALWARGLEACGYASGAHYADKLIRTIELYDLEELDYYRVEYVKKSKIADKDDHLASPE
jgi:flagellum-specific peptidoglycan hydrolase FlgJ